MLLVTVTRTTICLALLLSLEYITSVSNEYNAEVTKEKFLQVWDSSIAHLLRGVKGKGVP
jgi:hypothetical protein